MAAPPNPFPEGDPRNARWFEESAKLNYSREHEAEEGKGARERLKTNTEYGLGQIGKQEPEANRQLRNRANKGGILHSGIAYRRQGNLQTQFAAKRYALTHGEEEKLGQMSREEKNREHERTEKEGANSNRSLVEGREYAEAHPPAAAVSPVTAAATRRVGGKYVRGPKGERIYQAWS